MALGGTVENVCIGSAGTANAVDVVPGPMVSCTELTMLACCSELGAARSTPHISQ